jgi:hypothetical protein
LRDRCKALWRTRTADALLIIGSTLGYPAAALDCCPTAAAAVKITSATALGCETLIMCEPSASVIVAPARSAVERITSVPAALSPVARTVQADKDFDAGGPAGAF